MTATPAPVRRLIETAHANNRAAAVVALRVAESLIRREIPALSRPVIGLGTYAATVEADMRSSVGLGLRRYGFHDPVAWAVDGLLAPGDCFIDAGANIGLMTLVGAARVGDLGRVISCEPSPATAELLRRNVRNNGFGWVDVVQAAVADAPGRAELVEFGAGAGVSSLAPETRAGGAVTVVELVRLDDLARALPAPPALVKLDVEGAEVKALRGAPELLASGRTSFIIEVEEGHLERQGSTVSELQALFEGYEPFAVARRGRSFGLIRWTAPWTELPTTPDLVLRPAGGAR
jgi:FkbM family methyltransferase